MIPNNFFEDCAIKPISNIVRILRAKNISVPIIGFPFKAGTSLERYSYESLVDCIALDWSVDLNWANQNINKDVVIQGNLDPASLIPNKSELLKSNVLSILKIMGDRRLIFNVGHGLTPEVKIKNVKYAIKLIDDY